jgi:hypothetical protein
MGRGIPPAYILNVLTDRVLLSGELRNVFHMLKGSHLRDRVSRETPSTLAVRFAPEDAGHFENPDLHTLLRWLTEHGVAFASDRGQQRSVADFAFELQGRGLLPRRITSIEWSNQDQWTVKEHIVRTHLRSAPTPVA